MTGESGERDRLQEGGHAGICPGGQNSFWRESAVGPMTNVPVGAANLSLHRDPCSKNLLGVPVNPAELLLILSFFYRGRRVALP